MSKMDVLRLSLSRTNNEVSTYAEIETAWFDGSGNPRISVLIAVRRTIGAKPSPNRGEHTLHVSRKMVPTSYAVDAESRRSARRRAIPPVSRSREEPDPVQHGVELRLFDQVKSFRLVESPAAVKWMIESRDAWLYIVNVDDVCLAAISEAEIDQMQTSQAKKNIR